MVWTKTARTVFVLASKADIQGVDTIYSTYTSKHTCTHPAQSSSVHSENSSLEHRQNANSYVNISPPLRSGACEENTTDSRQVVGRPPESTASAGSCRSRCLGWKTWFPPPACGSPRTCP